MRNVLLAITLLMMSFSLQAEELNLAQFKGKVVYVDFWASWCGPCRNSFPWMQDMQKRYADKGLVIIAINLDQEPQLAKKFLQEFPVDFRVEYDPKGKQAEKLEVTAMPTSFLLDRTGKIREKHNGFFDEKRSRYESEIVSLLGE